MPIVQAIVGHTNAAMTRHYLHISPAELAAAMSKFKAIPAAAGMLQASGADTPAEAAGRPADGAALALRAITPNDGADAPQGAESATMTAFRAAALALPVEERSTALAFLQTLAH